jgi:putative two-component system response regulator
VNTPLRVLAVEDSEDDTVLVVRLLQRGGYDVTYERVDTAAAVNVALERQAWDIVIADYSIPGFNGLTALALCKERGLDVPFIIVSGTIGEDIAVEAMKAGAHDYILKHNLARLLPAVQRELGDAEVRRKRKEAEKALQRSYDQLQETFVATVNALASTVEMKDPYTAGHQRRVTRLACAIAKEMGLPEERIEGIRMAGLIHDIGKINIPAEILAKPGLLSEIQYNMVKIHPQVGYDVLKEIKFPWPVAEIVLQHHERMDGSGYPHRSSGEEIILEARILAVADVVEAMSSHRPYRAAHGLEMALDEISSNKSTLFDPDVVDICLKLFEQGFHFD